VAALRGMVALPLILVFITVRRAWGRVWPSRWPLHGLRGVLSVAMLTLFTVGVAELPLANAYTLFFVAPLLITLLAIPFLGERVPPAHFWAIGVGLLGVLIALRPSPEAFVGWAGLAVLGSAACYAASAVAGRLLSRTDSTESLLLWIMLMLAVLAGVLAAPNWRPIDASHTHWLIGLGVFGFIGQLAITEAFRHGRASAVAPFEYTALAWGVGLDWALWQTLPDRYTLLGALVIVASGIYLIRHERVHAQAEVHTSTTPP
jgi:drug/metabolite transporter (DMT)-like permease